MFNDSLKRGSLPSTLNQALITLIPKKDKNMNDCSSWRPISLLNSDVKLLAKVLACRLDPCLPDIISLDQTGFVRGRQLSSNIRRLLNIVLSPNTSQDAEMIISLDAEKAFDRGRMGLLVFCFGEIQLWVQIYFLDTTFIFCPFCLCDN